MRPTSYEEVVPARPMRRRPAISRQIIEELED
jgi:hypothetical protein